MLFNRYSVLLGILKSAGSITCKTFVQQKLGGGMEEHTCNCIVVVVAFRGIVVAQGILQLLEL